MNSRKRTSSLLALTAIFLMTAPAVAQNRTFDVSPGGRLTVDIESGGDFDIRAWDRNQVEIRVEVTGRDADDMEVSIDQDGDRIDVFAEPRTRRNSMRADVDVTVRVPKRFNLDLSTMGGTILIEGIDGTIKSTSMGGDLTLTGLGGQIDATTMGGKIELRDSDVNGKVHTMGGNVTIRNVTGNVNGTTMGGNVTYDNVRSSKNGVAGRDEVKINTMGGNVEVDEALYGADLHTMGGRIDVRTAKEYVKATTMGGDIRIHEIDGWVEAETMGGDVEINMVGGVDGDRHVEIESMGGEIWLTVPRGLAMKFDVEIGVSGNKNPSDFRIVSDFELDVEYEGDSGRGRWRSDGKIQATGQTGNGRNTIRIRTVNGDVHLRQGN